MIRIKDLVSRIGKLMDLSAIAENLEALRSETVNLGTSLLAVISANSTSISDLKARVSELEVRKPEVVRVDAERPELTKLDDGNYVDASRATSVVARWVPHHWVVRVMDGTEVLYESDPLGSSQDEAEQVRDKIAFILCTGLG